MSELLEAAVAAREVGLAVPECEACWRCPKCHGDGNLYHEDTEGPSYCRNCGATGSTNRTLSPKPDPACQTCRATGINPDPARLGWVAMIWLLARHSDLSVMRRRVSRYESGESTLEAPMATRKAEDHDGTETGIATALLSLVARVGGKP